MPVLPFLSRSVRSAAGNTFAGAVCVVVFGLLSAGCETPLDWGRVPAPEQLAALSVDQWIEDLSTLVTELPRRNPHFAADPAMAARFAAAVGQSQILLRAAPADRVGDTAITAIARSLALVGEGHTSLNASPSVYFPLVVRWFHDQAYVASADERYAELLGRRVVAIVDSAGVERPIEELEPELNSLLSVDHANAYRHYQANVLINPHLLRGIGLADATGVRYVLADGSSRNVHLIAAVPVDELTMRRAYDDAPEPPIFARSNERNWYTIVGENADTLYLHYSNCTTDAYQLFQNVVDRLSQATINRLIVDLRANSGGNSLPGTWFANQVAALPRFQTPGSIFVLIGPGTFSSGMWAAVDLMHRTPAVFVGQPMAANPDWWGEVKRFALPHSGLVVGHSIRLFQYSRGKRLRLDADNNLVPDPGFVIAPTFDEYRTGSDPVFDAALTATATAAAEAIGVTP